MFLEGSEMFISAILASRVEIRVLNYDADLEILTSGLQYPHFDHFLVFSKTILLQNSLPIFFRLVGFQKLPGNECIRTSSDRSENFIKKHRKTKQLEHI